MKRLILGIALMLVPSLATATQFQDFVTLKRRAAPGDTVIRAFPNATNPSFRLILEGRGTPSDDPFGPMFCTVWLEFVPRGHPIDHYGLFGNPREDEFSRRGPNFRELVTAPLDGTDEFDEHGRLGTVSSFREDLHWVARGTNDALHLLRADVGLDENGACVAGTDVRFTPNLAYRDVVDRQLLTTYGEARIRGFPGNAPTFTLFLEYFQAGTVIDFAGFGPITLAQDECVLSIEVNPTARPFWTRDLAALSDYFLGDRLFLMSGGLNEGGLVAPSGGTLLEPRAFTSLTTGEAFVIVDAAVHLATGPAPDECSGSARVQFAPDITGFYR